MYTHHVIQGPRIQELFSSDADAGAGAATGAAASGVLVVVIRYQTF